MSDSQDGQHVKTPDYFINPIGVLHQVGISLYSSGGNPASGGARGLPDP